MKPLAVFAGVALALAVGVVGAQTVGAFNLSSSISRAQAPLATICRPTATQVACPGDTKSQLHYLRGSGTVYLGLSPSTTAADGLPLTGANRQAWDVGGPLVYCITDADAGVTMETVCGRGP